ncbi:MAG: MMPL family transporter, partial [Deltaproteobacteria bacterium]|nr:MMPL family transporter [Deltaproteobacteria bacterium]
KDNLSNTCRSWMRALRFCAWPIIAIAVLIAVASVYYTLAHLKIDTSRSALVGSSKHLVKLSHNMDQAFGGRDGLVVVIENGHPQQTIKFAEALATELRGYPDRFPELFYRMNPEILQPWAMLYLDQKDLLKIKSNLADQRNLLSNLAADPNLLTFYRGVNDQIARAMIGQLFTGFLDDQKAEETLPDVTLLNATLKQLLLGLQGERPYVSPFNAFFPKELSDLSQEGYFFTENDKFLLFLVTPQPDGYTTRNRDVALLREVVHRVEARFPGIQAGVTGPDALESDEMGSSLADISLATWLSLAGQMGLLLLFLRSVRRPLVQTLTLIIGLCWTFGLVTLVVGRLNLLSMIFAPLMLGLTIDYGIHYFCRLEEEQTGGKPCTFEILTCAYQRTAPGIFYAGVAAALSFLPLIFMGFTGLAELGLILTMGILVMLVATLVLVPALVSVTERCTAGPEVEESPPQPFLHLHWTQPWLIVALGVAIVGLGAVAAWRFVPFDLNPLHLQNQRVESVVWEYKLIQDSKYSTSYGAVATSSLEELQERITALKQLPTVSHVESILSFLPSETDAKRPLLEKLREVAHSIKFPKDPTSVSSPAELAAMLSRINFKIGEAARNLQEEKAATAEQIAATHDLINRIIPLLNGGPPAQVAARLGDFERQFFADLQDKWNLLEGYVKSALDTPALNLADLPQAVRQRFISEQGTFLIRVFPSQDIWNFEPLKLFVKSLWGVDPNAVGDPVLLYVFTLGFRNACLKAAAVALLAIAAMLLVLFRSWKMTLLAVLPLIVGTGLTLSLMWLLGISFNQANVLFVPLVLGEGIEFGIIILMRWRLEESARSITLPASTAKGVALAALTTTVGFGSLMVSGHHGVFSLGLLATVGSLSVLVASLSFLPAFIRVMEREYEPREPSFHPYLGMVRWFNHMVRKKAHEQIALASESCPAGMVRGGYSGPGREPQGLRAGDTGPGDDHPDGPGPGRGGA